MSMVGRMAAFGGKTIRCRAGRGMGAVWRPGVGVLLSGLCLKQVLLLHSSFFAFFNFRGHLCYYQGI